MSCEWTLCTIPQTTLFNGRNLCNGHIYMLRQLKQNEDARKLLIDILPETEDEDLRKRIQEMIDNLLWLSLTVPV